MFLFHITICHYYNYFFSTVKFSSYRRRANFYVILSFHHSFFFWENKVYAIKWSVIRTVTIKVVPFSNSSKNACTSFQWIRIECKVYRWRFNERINRWNTDKSGTLRAAILGWKMVPWLALANKHIGSMFKIRGQNSTSVERFLNSSRTFPRRRRGGRKKESKENKSFKEILIKMNKNYSESNWKFRVKLLWIV